MRLTIAYFKIKKAKSSVIYNDTHQRETLSERPIRLPLNLKKNGHSSSVMFGSEEESQAELELRGDNCMLLAHRP